MPAFPNGQASRALTEVEPRVRRAGSASRPSSNRPGADVPTAFLTVRLAVTSLVRHDIRTSGPSLVADFAAQNARYAEVTPCRHLLGGMPVEKGVVAGPGNPAVRAARTPGRAGVVRPRWAGTGIPVLPEHRAAHRIPHVAAAGAPGFTAAGPAPPAGDAVRLLPCR